MSKHLKQRLIMGLIAIPLAFLLITFDPPAKIVKWTFNGIAVIGMAFVLYYVIQVHRTMRELSQSKAKTEEWKRRIRSVADTAESPDDDLTFDEFCEFEDEKVLAEVVQELKKMPSGQRNLKKACEIVDQRVAKVGA
jgi:hypothetical protein